MSLTQKRTCNGCKALDWMLDACDLKFPILRDKSQYGTTKEYVPAEPCPKPKTQKALAAAERKV